MLLTRILPIYGVFAWAASGFQLGSDTLSKIYPSVLIEPEVKPEQECPSDLAQHLWRRQPSSANSVGTLYNIALKTNKFSLDDLELSFLIFAEKCKKPKNEPEGIGGTNPVLLHGAIWSQTKERGPFSLVASEWEVYTRESRPKEDPILLQTGYRKKGREGAVKTVFEKKPPLYGNREITFVGINCFVDDVGGPLDSNRLSGFDVSYKIGTTAVMPENEANALRILQALLGTATGAAKVAAAESAALNSLQRLSMANVPNNVQEDVDQAAKPYNSPFVADQLLQQVVQFANRAVATPPCRYTVAKIRSQKSPFNIEVT